LSAAAVRRFLFAEFREGMGRRGPVFAAIRRRFGL